MKLTGRLIVFTLILVTLTVACKLLFANNLDWSGFSPLIAIALFSGMIIKEKNISFVLPLLALFLSDLVIQILYEQNAFKFPGFYPYQLWNYLFLMSATLVGWAVKGRSYVSLAIGAVAAPTVYFLISNFAVWVKGEVVYSKDFNGLMTSYTNGLPFYRNALIASLLFVPVISFTYNFLAKHRLALKLA